MIQFRLISDFDGLPIAGATVRLLCHDGKVLVDFTGEDGKVNFEYSDWPDVTAVEVSPIPGHWSYPVERTSTSVVKCLRLPSAVNGQSWWHAILGLENLGESRGGGLRIGVIDTGCGPHHALEHAQALGTWINGNETLGKADDAATHGTHVAGLIAARVSADVGWQGISPGVDLLCARVWDPISGANQADIANAIDAMVEADVDIINISLAAHDRNLTLSDAIENAWLNGVVCVAAAGNLSQPVMWPAAHEHVIAVTAFARQKELPLGTLCASRIDAGSETCVDDGIVFPGFNCTGPNVNCCAPGVGIVSAIPHEGNGSWADMDGTSVASPIACGLLAVKLSQDTDYQTLPRTEVRSYHIWQTLEFTCLPLNNVNIDTQGFGRIALNPW